MIFWFNEFFLGRLTFVRCAKVGELYATTVESEKITVRRDIVPEIVTAMEVLAFFTYGLTVLSVSVLWCRARLFKISVVNLVNASGIN
jgi:hypothetical protein